jgi:hypothetical protein
VDKHAKIELLRHNSFVFEADLTLDEMEWTRILGPSGLGDRLLREMVGMGADFFEVSDPDHQYNHNGEVLFLKLEGADHEFRLDYDQPFVASLQEAVRQVLDGVNAALRRQMVAFRYICVRDTCTGAGCTYRLMLMPTPWLRELEDKLNVVAGVSVEDYEAQRPFSPIDFPQVDLPESGRRDLGGPMEAR